MTAEKYIAQLKRGVDPNRAIKIVEACMRATAPAERKSLPNGPIFTEGDKKGNLPLGDKELTHLHNWWKHCYHLLKKEQK